MEDHATVIARDGWGGARGVGVGVGLRQVEDRVALDQDAYASCRTHARRTPAEHTAFPSSSRYAFQPSASGGLTAPHSAQTNVRSIPSRSVIGQTLDDTSRPRPQVSTACPAGRQKRAQSLTEGTTGMSCPTVFPKDAACSSGNPC